MNASENFRVLLSAPKCSTGLQKAPESSRECFKSLKKRFTFCWWFIVSRENVPKSRPRNKKSREFNNTSFDHWNTHQLFLSNIHFHDIFVNLFLNRMGFFENGYFLALKSPKILTILKFPVIKYTLKQFGAVWKNMNFFFNLKILPQKIEFPILTNNQFRFPK